MKSIIFRHDLRLGRNAVIMHKDAIVVHVACKPQSFDVLMWTIAPVVDTAPFDGEPVEVTREFLLIGTGQEFDQDGTVEYAGSAITHDGFVWHVFEEVEPS